ncbi:hypothetical protein J6590_048353 [Homalodisca vitripennis]|nr:hypothetical protein J6590_048353 [Homalodisca vitripennis]
MGFGQVGRQMCCRADDELRGQERIVPTSITSAVCVKCRGMLRLSPLLSYLRHITNYPHHSTDKAYMKLSPSGSTQYCCITIARPSRARAGPAGLHPTPREDPVCIPLVTRVSSQFSLSHILHRSLISQCGLIKRSVMLPHHFRFKQRRGWLLLGWVGDRFAILVLQAARDEPDGQSLFRESAVRCLPQKQNNIWQDWERDVLIMIQGRGRGGTTTHRTSRAHSSTRVPRVYPYANEAGSRVTQPLHFFA